MAAWLSELHVMNGTHLLYLCAALSSAGKSCIRTVQGCTQLFVTVVDTV